MTLLMLLEISLCVLAIQILKSINYEIIKCLIIFIIFIISMYQHKTAFPNEKLKLKEGSAWFFSFTKCFLSYYI